MSENITAVLNIVANDQASNALKQVKDTTKKQKDEVERLIASTKRLVDRQNKHKNVLDQLKLAQNNATDAQKAQLAMLHQQISANQKANGSLRMIRGGFGQMGHQVQDVAVQLQGGTDAMIVFGQQGSQIVSLFGPGGAMIGALLAVGAAIFSGVTMMSREAKKELEELTNTVTEQRKELGLLTAEELAYQDLQKRKQTDEQIKKQEKLTKKIARTESVLAALKDMFERDSEIQMMGRMEGDLTPALEGLQRDIERANEKLIQQKAELAEVAAAGDENTQQAIEAAQAEKDRKERVQEIIDALNKQADTLGKTAREQAIYNATNAGAEPDELAAIERIYDRIDAHNEEQEALKKAEQEKRRRDAEAKKIETQENARLQSLIKSLEDFSLGKEGILRRDFQLERTILENASLQAVGTEQRRNALLLALREQFNADLMALETGQDTGIDPKKFREENLAHMLDVMAREDEAREEQLKKQQQMAQAKQNLDMQVLSSAQSLASGLLGQMKKGSTAYKAVFAAQQALAIAQTIINTEMAAAAAIAPPPVGLGFPAGVPYQGVIRGMGAASVALIAAQTAASFEGGGFTGRGSRSGGVDGRGGFPAILHPNETVIDHEGGGMQPVVVNQTINVTTGVQQTVRAEVANLLPQISEAAKAAVAEGRMRGGSYGTAMGI